MKNEIRFYIDKMLEYMYEHDYEPSYLVTAVQLPTGAIELAVNTSEITEKLKYILEAYDEDMHLISNTDIEMKQIMIV